MMCSFYWVDPLYVTGGEEWSPGYKVAAVIGSSDCGSETSNKGDSGK